MRYVGDLSRIWESYVGTQPESLTAQAFPEQGTPISAGPVEDCEESDEAGEIKMILADLAAIHKQSAQLLQILGSSQDAPAWVLSRITVANQYITDVAQYLEFDKSAAEKEEEPKMTMGAVQSVRIVAI